METLTFIQKITQGNRALIITCLESCLDIEQRLDGQVFRYTALGNIVNPADNYQMESIRSFVEFKNCSKVILAGHHDCRVLNSILCHKTSVKSPLNFAQTHLTEIFTNCHCSMLSEDLGGKVLIEQNVIAQCHALMKYKPFQDKIQDGQLEIIGLLLGPNGTTKQIFSNGLSYNNLIAMN